MNVIGFNMQNSKRIEKAVKETLSSHFDHIHILDINIRKDVDADGDDVLRIDVVFEGSPKDLDVAKLTGTVRKLRPKLDKIEESAFPLLSFISAADYNARASR